MKKLAFLGVFLLLVLSFNTAHADALPDGCTATTAYSSTTGHPCTQQTDCAPGDLYSSQTGLPCSSNYLPGCTSTVGYSVTTGSKCDGSTPEQSLINQLTQLVHTMQPNTTEATAPTPPVSDTLQITFTQPQVAMWWSATSNRIIGSYTLSYAATKVFDLTPMLTIDGVLNGAGSSYVPIGDSFGQYSNNDMSVTKGFDTLNLLPGDHIFTVTADGQTQSITFTVPPYVAPAN